MKKYHLTSEQLEAIKNEYHNTSAKDLAIRCECSVSCIYSIAFKYHLKKDKEFISEMAFKNMQDPNHKGRQHLFKKGSVSHNEGLKQSDYMSIIGIEKSKATRFNKGHTPKNYLPVGTERLTKDGYVKIKTEEGLRGWRLKHRVVWEQANGLIPKGYNIQFRDKNRQNVVLENLYLINRVDQLNTENSIYRYPKELSNIIRLKGALKRQINKKRKHE